jgi:hypothetical protein
MTAPVREIRPAQPGSECSFELVEAIRAEIRSAGLKPATHAELRKLDMQNTEALANAAIEGIEPDAEFCAFLTMLRDERVSPRDYDRFYDRFLDEKWVKPARK